MQKSKLQFKSKKYLLPIVTLVLFVVVMGLTLAIPAVHAAYPIKNPAEGYFVDFGTGKNTVSYLLLYVINGVLGVIGLVALLFLIVGGFQYVTAAGNEEQATKAKQTVTNAIIGLTIVILSYIIVVVVVNAIFGKTGANNRPASEPCLQNDAFPGGWSTNSGNPCTP